MAFSLAIILNATTFPEIISLKLWMPIRFRYSKSGYVELIKYACYTVFNDNKIFMV